MIENVNYAIGKGMLNWKDVQKNMFSICLLTLQTLQIPLRLLSIQTVAYKVLSLMPAINSQHVMHSQVKVSEMGPLYECCCGESWEEMYWSFLCGRLP